MEKVFISYSHDSDEHATKVLSFANRLVKDGIDCVLDQYSPYPSEGWPLWMERNIAEADFVLMICTQIYYNRVMRLEEKGKGLGVKWEGKLIYNKIYKNDSANAKFIPVLFNTEDKKYIPGPLEGCTFYLVTNKQELELLDAAWENPHTRIISFIAFGGVGKSALVNAWLNNIEEAGEQRYVSFGLFARAALYRYKQSFALAWADLDEAREIAYYGSMKLHLTDYYLGASRVMKEVLVTRDEKPGQEAAKGYFILEEGEQVELSREGMKEKFREFLKKAEGLIAKTGYHRRDGELTELKKWAEGL